MLYELLTGAPPFREPSEPESDTLLDAHPARPLRAAAPRGAERAARGSRAWCASLLRAKPRGRPGSAQLVRRMLERAAAGLPADARLELASWLWQQGVFQPREGETVVVSVSDPRRRSSASGAGWAIAAALVAALLIGSFVRVEPPVLARWIDGALSAFEMLPPLPPPTPAP